MQWIDGAEAKVLGLVDFPWLKDWKQQGVLGHLCALFVHPDLQGLCGHSVVFMLVV